MRISSWTIAAISTSILSNPLGVAAGPLAERQTVQGVQNALGIGKDPSPLSRIESGVRQYYFPGFYSVGMIVYMQASNDLNTVLSVASNNHTIYKSNVDAPGATGLFQYGPNNYLLFVTSTPPASTGRKSYITVLQNDGTDLTKNWKNIGQLKGPDGNTVLGNYDPEPFNHPNGKNYILYSQNANSIVIAQLTSETTLTGATQVVGRDHTAEAPGALIQGSTLNIYWSEYLFSAPTYNVNRLSIPTSADPINKASYSNPNTQVILASNSTSGVYGPGSAGTFVGPGGANGQGQPWISYSCFYTADGQKNGDPRRVQAQPVVFNGEVMASMAPVKPSRYVTSTSG